MPPSNDNRIEIMRKYVFTKSIRMFTRLLSAVGTKKQNQTSYNSIHRLNGAEKK